MKLMLTLVGAIVAAWLATARAVEAAGISRLDIAAAATAAVRRVSVRGG